MNPTLATQDSFERASRLFAYMAKATLSNLHESRDLRCRSRRYTPRFRPGMTKVQRVETVVRSNDSYATRCRVDVSCSRSHFVAQPPANAKPLRVSGSTK